MAAFPGATSKPGFVTLPTPLPPVMRISALVLALSEISTFAPISALWVISGSSPASLITVQTALLSDSARQVCMEIAMGSPVSREMRTFGGNCPVSRYCSAPLTAAAAAAPVVKPVRSFFSQSEGKLLIFSCSSFCNLCDRNFRMNKNKLL